tara:strand:- start:1768 stop:2412 length:645 start_codon:yes stop_codon:yes gene_type:complete
MSKKLILIRHGESLWNLKNIYTGWANPPLTNLGIKQAFTSGKLLFENNIIPDITFTSSQKRSIDTNLVILKTLGIYDNTIRIESWRLNERHYGKLTGLNKDKIKWKGEYFDVPPVINNKFDLNILINDSYNPRFGESYYMTYLRLIPIWEFIIPFIKNNCNPIICSHKNTIKSLMLHIESLNKDEINNIEVPNASPIVYYFDDNLNFVSKKILV